MSNEEVILNEFIDKLHNTCESLDVWIKDTSLIVNKKAPVASEDYVLALRSNLNSIDELGNRLKHYRLGMLSYINHLVALDDDYEE